MEQHWSLSPYNKHCNEKVLESKQMLRAKLRKGYSYADLKTGVIPYSLSEVISYYSHIYFMI